MDFICIFSSNTTQLSVKSANKSGVSLKNFFIYLVSILFCILIAVFLGSELLTQYEMFSTGLKRHELGEDLGFGILLFIGLVPELIIGLLLGVYIGKCINT